MNHLPTSRVTRLVQTVHDLLNDCGDSHLQDLLTLWPDAHTRPRSTTPRSLPVVRWVQNVVTVADAVQRDLARALSDTVTELMWSQNYDKQDFGQRFVDNYGFVELVGTRGPYPSDRIASGIFMLGPHLEYPMHSHDAEEYYFPLTPGTSWKQDTGPWFAAGPGEFVYNHSRLPHAIRTGAHPMLAIYLWHGKHLTQRSRIH